MENIQKIIGLRLREIRNIFKNGDRASIEEFAESLKENHFNIGNYESGRANIPNRVLIALWERGFEPSYILTGIGSKFARNEKGELLRKIIGDEISEEENNMKSGVKIISEIGKMSIDELQIEAQKYVAAAADIMSVINKKK